MPADVGVHVLRLKAEEVTVTPHGTIRTLKSEGEETDERLRVFVAEGSASDLFWLEMVFKSSRLPYSIEVATNAQAAKHYLENDPNASQMDLIFLDTIEVFHQLSVPGAAPVFLITNAASVDAGERVIEKPFTQQKLLDCLAAAGLDLWATRLTGKPSERATAA